MEGPLLSTLAWAIMLVTGLVGGGKGGLLSSSMPELNTVCFFVESLPLRTYLFIATFRRCWVVQKGVPQSGRLHHLWQGIETGKTAVQVLLGCVVVLAATKLPMAYAEALAATPPMVEGSVPEAVGFSLFMVFGCVEN